MFRTGLHGLFASPSPQFVRRRTPQIHGACGAFLSRIRWRPCGVRATGLLIGTTTGRTALSTANCRSIAGNLGKAHHRRFAFLRQAGQRSAAVTERYSGIRGAQLVEVDPLDA
jgi:hypothetical protein